jgi:hypothetical protein
MISASTARQFITSPGLVILMAMTLLGQSNAAQSITGSYTEIARFTIFSGPILPVLPCLQVVWAMIIRQTSRLAATLTGLMISLWIVLLHIPRAAADLRDSNETTAVFEALAISGASFLIAALPRKIESKARPELERNVPLPVSSGVDNRI